MLDFIIGISCIFTLGIGLYLLSKQEERLCEKKLKNDIYKTKLIIEELKKDE